MMGRDRLVFVHMGRTYSRPEFVSLWKLLHPQHSTTHSVAYVAPNRHAKRGIVLEQIGPQQDS